MIYSKVRDYKTLMSGWKGSDTPFSTGTSQLPSYVYIRHVQTSKERKMMNEEYHIW